MTQAIKKKDQLTDHCSAATPQFSCKKKLTIDQSVLANTSGRLQGRLNWIIFKGDLFCCFQLLLPFPTFRDSDSVLSRCFPNSDSALPVESLRSIIPFSPCSSHDFFERLELACMPVPVQYRTKNKYSKVKYVVSVNFC